MLYEEAYEKCVLAIIRDISDDMYLIGEYEFSYGDIKILFCMAIYLHSYKCAETINNFICHGIYNDGSMIMLSVIVADNVDFVKFLIKNRENRYSTYFYKSAYTTSVNMGSRKVSSYLYNYLGCRVDVKFEKMIIDDSYRSIFDIFEKIRSIKELSDVWELKEYSYDNYIQWFPREIMEEQQETTLKSHIESLLQY